MSEGRKRKACVHHWKVDSQTAVKLLDERKDRPQIGRNAQCRKCRKKTVLRERVWSGASSWNA